MTVGLLAIAFLWTLAIRCVRRAAPFSPMHASASGAVGAYGAHPVEHRDPSARASLGPSRSPRSPSSSPDPTNVAFALGGAAGIGAAIATVVETIRAITIAVGIAGVLRTALEMLSAIVIVVEEGTATAVAVGVASGVWTATGIVSATVTVIAVVGATAIAVVLERRSLAGSYVNVGGTAAGVAGGRRDRTVMTAGHPKRSGATFAGPPQAPGRHPRRSVRSASRFATGYS